MSSVEYDVLIKMNVARNTARALGDAAKPLGAKLSQIERQQAKAARAEAARQKAAGREFLRQNLSQERALARGIALRERAERKSTTDRLRAEKAVAREQEKTQRRNQMAERKAAAERAAERRKWAASARGAAGGVAGGMGGVGMGAGPSWAASTGAIIGGIIAGAITTAMAKGVAGGIGDNVKQEQQRGSIGTTLQLYDFNATDSGGKKRSDADQFTENIANAKWYQGELIRIADAAPGDIDQVATLFQGILPGAASITQDADRIVDLTQKATLLAAVLDNDFKTVGAQSARILTGGAGAEFETWNRLQKPIRQAGMELGVFNKNQKLGTALTEKFNKLDPEKRLELFEAGLKRLGKPVADYFENSFEGITSQARSSMINIRRELGKSGFDTIKGRLKNMTAEGGLLNKKSESYGKMKDFASFLGDQVGRGIGMAMDTAERATLTVVNNWQTIVEKAQVAGHYIVSGAKLAVSLMSARAGAGMIAGGASVGMKGVGSIVSAVTGLAALGPVALIAAPALLAFGVVAGGVAVIFGGAVAYIVTNLDELSDRFSAWKETAGPTIDAFWKSVDDLSAKFLAVGEYFIGSAGETDIFTTATTMATNVVDGVTTAFSFLIGATADTIEALAIFADNATAFFAPFIGGPDYTALTVMQGELNELTAPGSGKWDSAEANALRDRIAAEEAKGGTNFRGSMKDTVGNLRAAQLRFDLARASDPNILKPGQGMYGNTPLGPQKPTSGSNMRKPPKVVQNIKHVHHWNVRDTDPNAVVAAFNKKTQAINAVPLASALAASRRFS